MTPKQIAQVQESWRMVIPIGDEAAKLFYSKLFESEPSLRALFKSDMTEQRRVLMLMIGTAVNSLDRLDQLAPAVGQLGKRHATYGVTDAHYDIVGAALLSTLADGLGPAFTAEVREGWIDAYTILASTMKSAAAESSLANA